MQNELKDLKEEIERKEKVCSTFREKMEQQKEQIEQLRVEREEAFQNTVKTETDCQQVKNLIGQEEGSRGQLKIDIMNEERTIADLAKAIKSEAEKINNTRKEIQKVKREYKKQEVLRDQQQEIIK
jgi:predicted  nucleic acid-binding Zn-ribbon protein